VKKGTNKETQASSTVFVMGSASGENEL